MRARIGAELARLVDEEVPESMVSADLQARIQAMSGQLAQSGIGMDDYLRIMGKDPESFTTELREASERGRSRSTSRCGPWSTPRDSRSPTTRSRTRSPR